MTMSPPIIPKSPSSFAEQVLREEAERQVAAAATAESTATAGKAKANFREPEVSLARLNLKDDEGFPVLGNGPVSLKSPVWTNNAPPPKKAVAEVAASTSVSGKDSSSFLLPLEHQRNDATVKIPLSLTCARVMKATGAQIEASTSSQTKSISFVVRGKTEQIKAAKRQLWSLLAQNGSIEFEVPEDCLKFIIGVGGRALQSIESEAAAKIQIPKGEEWKGSITISGDFEGVALARDLVLAIVHEKKNKTSLQVDIDRILAPFLWDRELSGLDQYEFEGKLFPSLRINLFRSPEGAHLTLIGDREIVAEAESVIAATLIRLRSSIKSVSTHVPKSLHRLLIGPKGSILHQIEEESGCGISMPPSASDNEQVTIYGPEARLFDGLRRVMEQIKGMCSQSVPLPPLAFKLIQNNFKYRNDIRALEKDFGVFSHLNVSNSCVDIDGKQENVIQAMAQLKSQVIAPLAHYRFMDSLEIDQEYLKHVIGKRGQTLQQIQLENSVEIVIENELVSIIGGKESDVSAAKDQITSILSHCIDLTKQTYKLDSKYHGLLIGSKGANLATYHERYPSVLISFSSGENDSLTFRGPQKDVEACAAEMMAQADALRHEVIMNSYTQVITLPEGDFRKLQSKDRNYLIRFARNQDCRLAFSTEAGKFEITLQGLKRSCDACYPLIGDQIKFIVNRDSLTFTVDPQYHGILIGAEGKNLRHLIQKYGVKIDFPRKEQSMEVGDETSDAESSVTEASDAKRSPDTIRIVGPKGNISKARDELLELLNFYLARDNRETLTVPTVSIARIIGRNGATIEDIKIKTGCEVEIQRKKPESADVNTLIELSGTKEAIAAAGKLIEAIVVEVREQVEEGVSLKSSDCLRNFRNEYQRLVADHPTCTFFVKGNAVNLRGKSEEVSAAKQGLETLLNRIESGELNHIDLEVPERFFGKLLGANGVNIKALSSKFNCQIQVPRPKQGGPVKVFGESERIKACAAEIQSMCTQKPNKE